MNSCGFELDHYRELLDLATSQGFQFVTLSEVPVRREERNLLLLRHDIDFSVADALAMARLEAAQGVRATYCVLLHSLTYNAGEPGTRRQLREIAAAGHEIALHYDLSVFEEAGEDANEGIRAESDYLGHIVGCAVTGIAQHKPARTPRTSPLGREWVDAYREPREAGFLYVSDSGRAWRGRCAHEEVGRSDRLQILVHPEWWSSQETTRAAIVRRLAWRRVQEVRLGMRQYGAEVEEYLAKRGELDRAWEAQRSAVA